MQETNGVKIKWKAGEVLFESPSSIVYKALNLQNGSIFIVKKFFGALDIQLMENCKVNTY